MHQIKQEYNKLLVRWRRAEELDRELKLSDKHIPELRKILNGINRILGEIGNYTEEEMMNGFQEVCE